MKYSFYANSCGLQDDDGGSDVDDEENDGFFVEPFYLSEGEGEDSESEKSQEVIFNFNH